jgi:hypothetical protein
MSASRPIDMSSVTKEAVAEKLFKMRSLRHELRMLQEQLSSDVENFNGSLQDALAIGLVKLTFSPAPYLQRRLREEVIKNT